MDAFYRYKSICDSIKAAGMSVILTLHHFVHPAWFEAAGGFGVEDNVPVFLAYVARAAAMLRDSCAAFITFEEAAVYAVAGHILGVFPPGGMLNYHKAGIVVLNMLKAHTQAYHIIKAENMDIQVGFVHRVIEVQASLLSTTANEAFATDTVLRWFKSGSFLWHGTFFGRSITYQAPQPPPLDFLGVNVSPPPLSITALRLPSEWRMPISARGLPSWGSLTSPRSPSSTSSQSDVEHSASANLHNRASAHGAHSGRTRRSDEAVRQNALQLTLALLRAASALGKRLYVMDFGIDDKDDVQRPVMLREYYTAVLEAIEGKADVHGLFYYTLTDTFDWADGFHRHFGMYSLKAHTLERVPRSSSLQFMAKVHAMLPTRVCDVHAQGALLNATIHDFWSIELQDGRIHWMFCSKELTSQVVQSSDILPQILSCISERDIGAVLLTCRAWSTTLMKVMRHSPEKILSWEPWATSMHLEVGEAPPVVLSDLPWTVVVNYQGRRPHTVGEVTKLWFNFPRSWDHADVARILSQVRALRHLGCYNHTFRAAGARELAAPLAGLSALTFLTLEKNFLCGDGMAALAPALSTLVRLQTLVLDDNNLSLHGARAAARALGRLTNLTCLALNNNALGCAGAAEIGSAMTQLERLRSLGMHDNGLGDAGAAVLCKSLVALTTLTLLGLRNNALGAEGMAALAPALTRLTALESLGLHDNGLRGRGAWVVADVLRSLPALTLLNLSDNALGVEGARVLRDPLRALPRLCDLWLHGNDLGDDGVRVLVEDWREPRALTKLCFGRNNNVTDAAHGFVPPGWDGKVEVDWQGRVCSMM